MSKKSKVFALSTILLLVSATSLAGSTTSSASDHTTLTFWTYFTATQAEHQWIMAAVQNFEKHHPGATVQIVPQPRGAQYFSLFDAASLGKTGPDILNLWTGLYALRYGNYLVPLNKYLTPAQKASMIGLKYTAQGFNTDNSIYGIVSELQSYEGFYNKTLFHQAGINSYPTTYSQFLQDCAMLKGHGILPIVDGAYQAYNMFSYYLMNYLTASQITGLKDGSIKWTDPRIMQALTRYVALYKDGYVNPDTLTNKDPEQMFLNGKAAMILDAGSWNVPVFSKALGSNVGLMFIPQDPGAPSYGNVVSFPGWMTSVTSYSKHRQLALEFIQDALQPAVSGAMAKAGLVPADKNIPADMLADPLQKNLYQRTQTGHIWPMFDNLIQANIADAMNSVFGSAITGGVTPTQALSQLQQAWDSLPARQK
ncbi:MAG TPA: ABC transporter substrate-binding protein [bacterium]|nr:ABC transporter substrate-binding protein [bacterium]